MLLSNDQLKMFLKNKYDNDNDDELDALLMLLDIVRQAIIYECDASGKFNSQSLSRHVYELVNLYKEKVFSDKVNGYLNIQENKALVDNLLDILVILSEIDKSESRKYTVVFPRIFDYGDSEYKLLLGSSIFLSSELNFVNISTISRMVHSESSQKFADIKLEELLVVYEDYSDLKMWLRELIKSLSFEECTRDWCELFLPDTSGRWLWLRRYARKIPCQYVLARNERYEYFIIKFVNESPQSYASIAGIDRVRIIKYALAYSCGCPINIKINRQNNMYVIYFCHTVPRKLLRILWMFGYPAISIHNLLIWRINPRYWAYIKPYIKELCVNISYKLGDINYAE